MWLQWKELNDWRDGLKPGDKVVVVGFEHPQVIHKNGGNIYAIRGPQWRQCHVVSRSDIFPFEPEIEWEIAHENRRQLLSEIMQADEKDGLY